MHPLPGRADRPEDDRERLRRDPLGLLSRRVAEGGELPRVQLGLRSAVLVARPELVRTALVERLEHLGKPAFLRDSNRGHWGEGLTTLQGEPWRRRRACLRGVFGPERVRAHQAVVRGHARELVARWEVGRVIDLRHELRQLTAASAVRFGLGAELQGWGTTARPPVRTVRVPWAEGYGEDFTAVATDDVPLALTRPRAPAQLPVTVAIIDEAIAQGGDGRRPVEGEGEGDALSWMIAAGLEREAIIGELVQMLFAGHHTVPTTMLALVRVLARDPALAQRVRAEARAGLPHDAAAPSLTERVLQETMRVFPPAPILYREVLTPCELAGERLSPGTEVWVCTHVLHHDPRSFAEPERFEPERFAPSARGRIPPYAYLPFGAGPRTCAASRLAMMQMVETCAAIVREHALQPCGGDRFVVQRLA